MKKKLKLNDLKLQSFVTSKKEAKAVKGGRETLYSCMDYVTCDIVRCYVQPK